MVSLFPHPSLSNVVAGLFLSEKCSNNGATNGPCRHSLRVSGDAGVTWASELTRMAIQVAWADTGADAPILFYSSHNDEDGDWRQQGWYDSKLYKAMLSSAGGFVSRAMLLDHQAGMFYSNGVLVTAERTNTVGRGVQLFSSVDNAATPLIRSTFRNLQNDEVQVSKSVFSFGRFVVFLRFFV